MTTQLFGKVAQGSKDMRSMHTLGRRAGAVAVALLLATSLAAPAAYADDEDSSVPPPPAIAAASAPPAVPSSFTWSVQLPGVAIAGISPDLPAAIALAGNGTALTAADARVVVDTLTEQAKIAGVSLTSTQPPSVPAPAASVQDDGGSSD